MWNTDNRKTLKNALGRIPEGFILDLDGCMYLENEPTRGARDLIEYLRAKGKKIVFLTNNSSMRTSTIVKNLVYMGIKTHEDEIITPIACAGEFIHHHFGSSRVFHLGPPETKPYIEEWGHRFTERPGEGCEVVLLSCDTTITYEKLDHAVNFLQRGAALVVTNADPIRPGRNGEIRMETGAFLAALNACVPAKPLLIGKPSTYLFQKALKKMDLPKEAVIMIGDTPSTDIVGGKATGIRTVLINSGSHREALEAAQPDFVFTDLQALLEDMISDGG